MSGRRDRGQGTKEREELDVIYVRSAEGLQGSAGLA